MIELGRVQKLSIIKMATVGAYLNVKGNKEENILLPKKQVPENAAIGDSIDVFVYRDSSDRLISTINRPKIVLGEIRKLKVVDKTKIGAFLDWGLEKDLFLPFKEQTEKIEKNQYYYVGLYIDKSDRLCATMNLYDLLKTDSSYKENAQVKGFVYKIQQNMGAFVAIDGKYHGLISHQELFNHCGYGDEVECRVVKVRDDGKLMLSLREKAHKQMDKDSEYIYKKLVIRGGFMAVNDSTSPEIIKKEFNMSKKAFKRAIGHLLKEKKIFFIKDGIQKL